MHFSLQVVLSFYEKRRKQQWGFNLGKPEERLFWEQWCVILYLACFLDDQKPEQLLKSWC